MALDYKKTHGNCNIKGNYIAKNGFHLGSWFLLQRRMYINGKLSSEKAAFIRGLVPDVKMDVRKSSWNDMYLLLKEYYNKNGNSNISTHSDTNNIGYWVNTQRKAYKGHGTHVLNKEQIKLLNELEFDWCRWDTTLLNSNISLENTAKYNKTLLKRIKNILEDLSYEIDGEITDISKQKLIENEIVKRMWK